MAGVQQPGMTGQVKEDIISRFFELGVEIKEGQLKIQPVILKYNEFIQPSVNDHDQFPMLSFTYCSIPVIYLIDGKSGIDILKQDKTTEHIDVYSLSHAQSQRVFNRDKTILKLIVHFRNEDNFSI